MTHADVRTMTPAQWTAYAVVAFDSLIEQVRRGISLNHQTNDLLRSFPA